MSGNEQIRDAFRDKVVYKWCLDLVQRKQTLQGIVLFLATWNFAHFRYHMKNFDVNEFARTLKGSDFEFFNHFDFETAKLDDSNIATRIEEIYKQLSALDAIGYVGATKVMHLLCPRLFLMWDTKIRKLYADRFSEFKINETPEGYVEFMRAAQNKWKEIRVEIRRLPEDISVPRAIDMYNMDWVERDGTKPTAWEALKRDRWTC